MLSIELERSDNHTGQPVYGEYGEEEEEEAKVSGSCLCGGGKEVQCSAAQCAGG
jgi:hypothetical protein